MMLCLLCRLGPITPDTPAGLCVSCRYAVKSGEFLPVASGDGFALRQVALDERLAPMPGERLGVWEYDPGRLYPDGATAEQLAEVRQQLHELTTPAIANRKTAKELLAAIRSHGIAVTLDGGEGRAVLDYPARCPYPLLIEFVRCQLWIEDALTRERAFRLAAEYAAANSVHVNNSENEPCQT